MLLNRARGAGVWDESALLQLMQSSGSIPRIRCDNADALDAAGDAGGCDAPCGSCGGGDVFGWSDSIARTVHG